MERFFFSKYFTFSFEGNDCPLTTEARTFLEGALSCTLRENSIAGGRLFTLTIPEHAQAKAERLLNLQCA